MISKNKRLSYMLLSIPVLLSIPLIAMQFTDEVNWDLLDFVVMGFLLLCVGLLLEMVLRLVKKKGKRTWLIIGIIILFLLVWAELAVGIFGTPFAGS